MYCPYCGAPVPTGSKNCMDCGRALNLPAKEPWERSQNQVNKLERDAIKANDRLNRPDSSSAPTQPPKTPNQFNAAFVKEKRPLGGKKHYLWLLVILVAIAVSMVLSLSRTVIRDIQEYDWGDSSIEVTQLDDGGYTESYYDSEGEVYCVDTYDADDNLYMEEWISQGEVYCVDYFTDGRITQSVWYDNGVISYVEFFDEDENSTRVDWYDADGQLEESGLVTYTMDGNNEVIITQYLDAEGNSEGYHVDYYDSGYHAIASYSLDEEGALLLGEQNYYLGDDMIGQVVFDENGKVTSAWGEDRQGNAVPAEGELISVEVPAVT